MTDTAIKIYGKMGWPFSQGARSAYGDSAVYIDVLTDKAKFKEMLAYTKGVSRVPVIVEGEKVTIGYGGSWTVWGPTGVGKIFFIKTCQDLQGS